MTMNFKLHYTYVCIQAYSRPYLVRMTSSYKQDFSKSSTSIFVLAYIQYSVGERTHSEYIGIVQVVNVNQFSIFFSFFLFFYCTLSLSGFSTKVRYLWIFIFLHTFLFTSNHIPQCVIFYISNSQVNIAFKNI